MRFRYGRAPEQCGCSAGEQAGYFSFFQKRADAQDKLAIWFGQRYSLQSSQAVDCNPLWFEVIDHVLHYEEMLFKPGTLGILAMNLEQFLLLHFFEIHAPTPGIAKELLFALLEGKDQCLLFSQRAAFSKMRHCERFAGTCRSRQENDGILEIAATAHGIKLLDATVNSLH